MDGQLFQFLVMLGIIDLMLVPLLLLLIIINSWRNRR